MKLIRTFLIGAATVALAGCVGGGAARGQKVSEDQFKADAAKAQEQDHQYSKATFKYKIVEKHKNDGDKDLNISGQATYTYGNSGWEADAGQNIPEVVLEMDYNIGQKISWAIGGVPDSKEYKVNYYKAPLGVSYSMSQKGSESGVSASYSIYALMEFDQYGYLVRGVSKLSSSTKISAGGQTVSVSTSEEAEFEIIYK